MIGGYSGKILDVNLSDGTIDIKWVKVWGDNLWGAWARTESIAGDKTSDADPRGGVFSADYIESVGTGSFTVGLTANTSTNDYWYVVVGE